MDTQDRIIQETRINQLLEKAEFYEMRAKEMRAAGNMYAARLPQEISESYIDEACELENDVRSKE